MGVKGKGLRADGLHKNYMNGSPEQHGSAAQRAHTIRGGGVTDPQLKSSGMHKRGMTGNVAEEYNPMGPGAFGHKLTSKNC